MRPSSHRPSTPRLRFRTCKVVAVGVAILVLAVTGALAASAALPSACSLLTRDEATTLSGVAMLASDDSGSLCIYNSDPNGPTAQVQIVVQTETPRTLELDRQLGHAFTDVAGLGDEAVIEEWNIFARKGDTWVAISLVRTEDWEPYVEPMRVAAALALSRIPAGASGSGKDGSGKDGKDSTGQGSVSVVGKLPAGGGSNPLWTGAEKRFGGDIGRLADVVYQPDVVVIGGGAGAVRGVSADGLTWTLGRSAPGVAKLAVGKVMLATTLASGRVLRVTPKGANVKVTVGPVSLTDVIRDGTFDSGGPVKLGSPLYYGQAVPLTPPKARKTAGLEASGARFTTTPICCTNTGVAIGYDNGAGRMTVAVNLFLKAPTVDFHIAISGGKLREASVQLNGTSALQYAISAATLKVAGNVRSGPIPVPGSITIPLAGPLSLTLTQSFDASLQLSGAASLKAEGEYAITGGLGFSYDGSFHPTKTAMATSKPIQFNTSSIGLGTNALSLGWAIRATVGVGLGGFSAGAWLAFKAGLALAMDGSPGSLTLGCITAGLSVTGQAGVGYTIPSYALTVVNAVLQGLGASPIAATGGPSLPSFTIWQPPSSTQCPKRKG